ncbi:MAG: GEVED domain-containing protein [Prochloraceae cyanobacterium]|nr:GEVED domain-containing protein [Prochloraceae cyanobacterium]
MRLFKSIKSIGKDYFSLSRKKRFGSKSKQSQSNGGRDRAWLYRGLFILGSLSAALLFAPEAVRALDPRDINLTIATDPFLAVDSNFCSTGEGPRAAYLGVTIENTSGGTLTGVTANLTGLTNGFTLGGGQAPEQFVGVLAAGESRTVYWYVQYFIDCTGGGGNFRVTRSGLNLTISDSNPGVVIDTERFVETRSSISASSGGLIINTTLGPGFFLGQTIPYEVEYEFGNVQRRDNFNLQPAGNLTYNAGCFQLVGSEVISSITDAIPVGTRDTLFFQASAQQTGSGNRATIRYFLRYLCTGVSTTASPYASQTSGNNNLKYTGNYEDPIVGTINLDPAINSLSISKTASPLTVNNPGEPITYTVTISNSASFDVTIDRIIDVLPAGISYVGLVPSSEITVANSGDLPTLGDTGTISWSGQPANNYIVPALGSIQLVYTVDTSNVINPGGLQNSVTATTGIETIGPASVTVVVPPASDLELTKIVNNPTPNLGDTVTFTVTLTNSGPTDASNVQVRDTIPAGLSNVVTNVSTGSFTNGVWSVPSLANGTNATLTITATVDNTGTIINTAEVIASDTIDPDSTPNNNIAIEDDQDSASVTAIVPSADLSLTKTVNNATPTVGEPVTFTVTLTNSGPDTATNVQVRDTIPVGLSNVVTNVSTGSFTNGVWNVPSLANGTNATLTITATVDNTGTIINTAEVIASDTIDPDSTPNNNIANEDDQDSASVTAAPPPIISGTVFRGGLGIQNIIVELLDNTGAAIATTNTAADGTYSFDAVALGLVNGNYTVRVFDPPLGQVQNLDPDPTFDSETLINFTGADLTNLNFGYDNAPAPPLIACSAPLSRFDWGTGATEQDYPIGVVNTPQNYIVNGANVTVTVTGDPNLLVASPTPNPPVADTPEEVARFLGLGISGGGIGNESLLFDVDSPQLTSINDTFPVVFEYSFDGPLTDVRFAIADIDTPGTNLESDPNERIDRVTVRGFAGAVEVAPILIPENGPQATFSVSGNVATGSTDNIGDGSSETENFGTLNVYFPVAVDRFTLTYSEAIGIYYGITTNTGTSRNPQTRAIAIGDIQQCIILDYGDAPDTYGTDAIAGNSSNSTDPVGASHLIVNGIQLGAIAPDLETDGQPTADATGDDNAVSPGIDDEDGISDFPTLTAGDTSYTIAAANLTVTNNTGVAATLHAWIDFDRDGIFQSSEYASTTVNSGINNGNPTTALTWNGIAVVAAGNTFARFRLTTDSTINANTPGGPANDGEVEDYQVAIVDLNAPPELLLVKRITAINGTTTTNGGQDLRIFNEDASDPNDNNPNWPDPNVFLIGGTNGGQVRPGDEVEYTVYFLSTGGEPARNVKICDVIPANTNFVFDGFGVNRGIALALSNAALPTVPTDLFTNGVNDGDRGDFYPVSSQTPDVCKDPNNLTIPLTANNNTNGAVLINVVSDLDGTDLPEANDPGIPANSYGFIRFKVRIQ